MPRHIVFGFTSGAHIKAFALSSFWQAFYYAHNGVMLRWVGIGDTPEIAVASLWQAMHKWEATY